jgi:hypothetical protein
MDLGTSNRFGAVERKRYWMPTYIFRNKKTGKEEEHFMSIKEAEQYVKDNPNLDWLCGAPLIGDPHRLGRKKPSDNFRENLRRIKKKNPGSNMNTF